MKEGGGGGHEPDSCLRWLAKQIESLEQVSIL